MTDLNKLYNERLERMDITMRGGTADRVPIHSMIDNWAIFNAGYTMQDILKDDEKHIKAYGDIAKDFLFDTVQYEGMAHPIKFYNILGGGTYTASEDGSLQVEAGKAMIMKEDEYPHLINNTYEFILNTLMPRKYKLLSKPNSEEKKEEFLKAIAELNRTNDFLKKSRLNLKEKYGMPVTLKTGIFHPLDILLDFLRDFEGIMIDIRRRPQEVLEACDALLPFIINAVNNTYPSPEKGQYITMPMHITSFIRSKMFEKVYWPAYKKLIEYFVNKGHVVMCYFEGNCEHLYDYFLQLPKNSVIGYFEKDDIRKAKEILGKNLCIAGGMSSYLLNYGTKEECVDHAKELIQDLAPGGGYIFTTDLILHSPNNAKAENIRAVNEYVLKNGKY